MQDNRTQFIENLINDNWPSVKAFAENIDIPYTTLRSMLQRGIGNASVNNVIKVCKGLGITIEDLERLSKKGEKPNIQTIAAHHDGEDWTDEELEEIERFKEFVKSRRQQE